MNAQLQHKVDNAIKLLQKVSEIRDDIELAYSGGKDSDVILELAKMAGIPFTAIYKNTTIDPPGTIQHAIDNGVKIVRPKETFFHLIEKKGLPNRFNRFCCAYLKEYKIKDTVIIGIRREESVKRAKRYVEPIVCRIYNKSEHVQQVLPILEWTTDDVAEFVKERNIKLAPIYYRDDGSIDFTRRLGCMCCPLATDCGLSEFKSNKKMVKRWLKALKVFWETHPNSKVCKRFGDMYEQFAFQLFGKKGFVYNKEAMFKTDYKQALSQYFDIEL